MRHAISIALLTVIIQLSSNAATFTVTTIADNGDNMAPTPGSLREAILDVNAAAGPHTIEFNIPGTAPFVIQPPVDLPFINETVTIDGYTQPGAAENTLLQGNNAAILIVLNGSNYTVGDGISTGNGLVLSPLANTTVDNSVIRGLAINGWLGNGILLDATNAEINNVQIIGNYIGTDNTGTTEVANRTGIGLSSIGDFTVNDTIIGTFLPADRNIIAGSFSYFPDDYGIRGACISSAFSQGTTIVNNYIGTDKTGTIALGNSLQGLYLNGDSPTLQGIGNFDRNVISGHLVFGLRLRGCNALVENNYIGTDVTGQIALGNQNAGIEIDGDYTANGFTEANTITNNLISGNGDGAHIGSNALPGAADNTFNNNKVGTDYSGRVSLSNTRNGVLILETRNTINDNVVSANNENGFLIFSLTATENVLTHNFIGTDLLGIHPLGNDGHGIQFGLYNLFGLDASDNTIGI